MNNNIFRQLIQRNRELDQERQEKKDAKKQMLYKSIKEIEDQMFAHQPISFKMAVAAQSIEDAYISLISRQEYVEDKLESLKDVKKASWYEPILFFILEIFIGIFVIYSLLYRVMGEEYFAEVTMTFGTDINPLYIALGFEALVIIMFSMGMKLYITSRFDEEKKMIVKSWMKYGLLAFVVAYSGFVFLSNI